MQTQSLLVHEWESQRDSMKSIALRRLAHTAREEEAAENSTMHTQDFRKETSVADSSVSGKRKGDADGESVDLAEPTKTSRRQRLKMTKQSPFLEVNSSKAQETSLSATLSSFLDSL